MTLPADRAGMNIGAGAQGEADLAEPSTRVNRSRGHALVFNARPRCERRRAFPLRTRRQCAARRPDDPPDRSAARRGRRRTRDARRHRSARGDRRAGAGGDRFSRTGGRTAGDWRPLRRLPGGDARTRSRWRSTRAACSASSLSERVDLVHVRSRWSSLGGRSRSLPQGKSPVCAPHSRATSGAPLRDELLPAPPRATPVIAS